MVLDVRDLVVSYGSVRALRGVDLALDPGDVVAVLGPNGAGKTTLLSTICGLVRADRGSIRVNGADPGRDPLVVQSAIGLAPQDLGIYPGLRARENLEFFGEMKGLRGAVLRERIDRVATALDLHHHLQRRAGDLSGGAQRRLHVATALVAPAPLLLLDEPTVGVDVETRSTMLDYIKALAAEGAAIFYSTHYLAEVEALGANVVVLVDGSVVARGALEEIGRGLGETRVVAEIAAPMPDESARKLRTLATNVSIGPGSVAITTDDPERVIRQVVACLDDRLGSLTALRVERPSLDTAFRSLVNRHHAASATGGNRQGERCSTESRR